MRDMIRDGTENNQHYSSVVLSKTNWHLEFLQCAGCSPSGNNCCTAQLCVCTIVVPSYKVPHLILLYYLSSEQKQKE